MTYVSLYPNQLERRNRLVSLDKQCFLCGGELVTTTHKSKKAREEKKFCSNKCKNTQNRLDSYTFSQKLTKHPN